jgi:hypothetical protein
MKNNYFYLILFLLISMLVSAQESITIGGPDAAEIGISYNYSFSFNPDYDFNEEDYRITHWQVVVTNIGFGDIDGFVDNETRSNFDTFDVEGDLSIPVQWGSSVSSDYSNVQVSAQGEYLDEDGYVTSTFDTGYLSINEKSVSMRRICKPIVNHTSTTDCIIEEIDIEATGYCSADKFQWSLDRGNIISGQGTSKIKVETPRSGDFQVTLVLGRNSADPDYTRTERITIDRNSPSEDIEVLYEGNTEPTYVCKYSGQQFAIEDNENIQSIEWDAQSSSISSESIIDGKRVVTVTPSASLTNGTRISVSAIINYIGGCTYNTGSRRFKVYEAEIPPTPSGYLYMEPINGNACDNEGYEVIFVPTNPYSNGGISQSRTILPPHAGNGPQSITVCYTNFCSNEQTCKTMTAYPPSPCNDGPRTLSTANTAIAPNPSTGSFTIDLGSNTKGRYELYNSSGALMQSDSFSSQIININFGSTDKNGSYFIRIITNGGQFTNQIILKR